MAFIPTENSGKFDFHKAGGCYVLRSAPHSSFECRPMFPAKFLDHRDVLTGCCPDTGYIHVAVIMAKQVPHAADLVPWQFLTFLYCKSRKANYQACRTGTRKNLPTEVSGSLKRYFRSALAELRRASGGLQAVLLSL